MIQQVPPHSNDAEFSVLGSMMISSDAVCQVIGVLDEECFYSERHKVIFSAMKSLFDNDEPIDLQTVHQRLTKQGKLDELGGASYLVEINNTIPTASNALHYAYILIEYYIKRWLINDSREREVRCFDETSDAIKEIEKSEKGLSELMARLDSITKLQTMYSLSESAFKKMINRAEGVVQEPGVKTGFIDVDDYVSMRSGDLVIVAARPSMGKTAFALNMARYVSNTVPVGMFSLEMTATSFYARLLAAESGVSARDIERNYLSNEQATTVHRCISRLAEVPIIIDDNAELSLLSLKSKAKTMRKQHGVGLIIIDYLQLMKPPKADSREREVGIISRQLKILAKELEIPIVALCQLNRDVEKRASKTPQLSDLRESGSLEQDASIVMMLNRLQEYGVDTYPDGSYTNGTAQVLITKNRDGKLGTVKLKFDGELTKFSDKDWLI